MDVGNKARTRQKGPCCVGVYRLVGDRTKWIVLVISPLTLLRFWSTSNASSFPQTCSHQLQKWLLPVLTGASSFLMCSVITQTLKTVDKLLECDSQDSPEAALIFQLLLAVSSHPKSPVPYPLNMPVCLSKPLVLVANIFFKDWEVSLWGKICISVSTFLCGNNWLKPRNDCPWFRSGMDLPKCQGTHLTWDCLHHLQCLSYRHLCQCLLTITPFNLSKIESVV